MKRLFKLLAWTFGGLVSLLVAAVVIVPLLFDPNDHKERIAAQVERYTGLPVRIDGDIGLTVFPWLGVELGRVELGQAPGFPGEVFARTGSMQVRVKLVPLLSKQVEMDTVTITGLEVNLARDADGRGNWQVPMEASAAAGGQPAPADAGGPPPIAALAIGGLDLQGAALSWTDALSHQSYRVSELNLKTGALDLSRPVPLALDFNVAGGTPALAGHLSLKADVKIDAEAQAVQANGMTLAGEFSETGALGGPASFTLTGDVGADGTRQLLTIAGMALDAKLGNVAAIGGGGAIALRGNVTADGAAQLVRIDGLALDANLDQVTGVGSGVKVAVRGDASADGASQQLRVNGLDVDADVATVTALGGPAKVKLGGELGADGASQVLALVGMQLEADLAGNALPGGKARVDASGDLRADLGRQHVSIVGLKGAVSQIGLLGATAGLNLAGDFDGDLAAQVFDLAGARFDGSLAGYPEPGSKVAFDGGAGVRFEAAARKFAVNDLKLSLPGLDLPWAKGSLQLATSIAGDLGAGRYVAKRVDLGGRLAGDALGGDLDFNLGTGLDANLGSGAVKLPGFGIDGNIAGPDIPGGKLPFNVTANIGANLNSDNLDLAAFKATAGPLKASGDLAVTKLSSAPAYKGTFSIAKFNPRKLLELLGQPEPEMADRKALTALEFTTGISGTANDVTLDPLALTLDGQSAKGRVQVLDFAKPGYRFDLAVDQFDADRYLPPQKAGGGQAATPGAAAGAAAGLPVETLRALDAQGQLRVKRLKFSNLKLADIVVTLSAADGLVKVSPLGAALYQGTYDGNLGIDARGQQAQVSVDERLSGVELGPLLKDLKNLDTLSGRADVQLRATAAGAGIDDIKRTLNGNAQFRLQDGEFKGVDIASTLCGLVSGGLTALGKSGFQQGQGGSTRFSDMTGTATITNGVVVNPDLLARSPLLRIDGRGGANLVTEQLDYTATAKLVASCQGQGGLLGGDLSGIDVPVRVGGTFSNPQYGLDTGALLAALANSQLRQKLQQGLGLPTAPAQPAQQVQQQPAQPSSSNLPPPRNPTTTQQQQQAQQPADPKKQAIEGLIKGLFGN